MKHMFDCDNINSEKTNRRYINDLILLAVVFLISAVLIFYNRICSTDADVVQISFDAGLIETVDGTLSADGLTLNMSSDGYYIFDSAGEVIKMFFFTSKEDADKCISQCSEYNAIRIKAGYIDVYDADCPDKICVNTKAISKNKESIICLPHKMVISLSTNTSDEDGPDAVTW